MDNKNTLFVKNKKDQHNTVVVNSAKIIEKVTSVPYEQESIRNFIKGMIIALEARDTYTKNHSARVSLFSEEIAKNLNLSPETVEVVRIAGLLHDIGKIGVSDKILLKKGRLNENELKEIEEHPAISEDICRPINFFNPILPIIRGHHERMDGSGYPDHKEGQDIHIGARIVSVADSFDALISNRSYRHGLSLDKGLSILRSGAGNQWDQKVVETFIDNLDGDRLFHILQQTSKSDKAETLASGTIFEI